MQVRSLVLDDPPPARPDEGGDHAAKGPRIGERVEQGDGPARRRAPKAPLRDPQVLAHGLQVVDVPTIGEVARGRT